LWKPPRSFVAFSVALVAALAMSWTTALAARNLLGERPQTQILGMNQTNLAWADPQQQAAILRDMSSVGIHAVRVRFSPPVARFVDLVGLARDQGIQVFVVVGLNDPAYYPEGTLRRPGRGIIHPAYRLSGIDVGRTKTALKQLFDALDSRSLAVTGFEIGNEINWADFNGDLSIGMEGPGQREADETSADANLGRGLGAYRTILEGVREERSASQMNRDTPIISAGLADIPETTRMRTGAQAVSADDTFQIMRSLGLGNLVDGAAIHFYGNGAPADLQHINQLLRGCQQFAASCWLTEWNVGGAGANNLGGNDVAEIDCIRVGLPGPRAGGNVAGLFYFEFSNTGPHATIQDGRLTAAGEASIAPFRPARCAGRSRLGK
jgi:hypothetical protein